MTKEALFNLFKRKKIPQGSGKDDDYAACMYIIQMQPQLSKETYFHMVDWAKEYVGVTNG